MANKVRGIRCAVCWSEYTAVMAKIHNNANIISIGQRTIDFQMAILIIDKWLNEVYEGGRHEIRIRKFEYKY